jgi:hypothetical protein
VTDELLSEISRAPVPDPGSAYWEAFGGRVRARIAGEGARSPIPFRSPSRLFTSRRWAPLAAAAAVALLAALLWLVPDGASGPAGGADPIAEIETRMDSALRAAVSADRVDLEEIGDLALAASASGSTAGSEAGDAEAVWDDEDALSHAGDLAALIAGEAGTAWSEWAVIDGLLDGLTDPQARALRDDLAPDGMESSLVGPSGA